MAVNYRFFRLRTKSDAHSLTGRRVFYNSVIGRYVNYIKFTDLHIETHI